MIGYKRSFAVTAILVAAGTLRAGTVSAQTDMHRQPPTFSKEIVRIFQARCQSCHYPDAPFVPMALTKYAEVRPWAKSIQKKVALKAMPPWHADHSGKEFANDLSLTADEIDAITQWVRARAPRGNPADLPPATERASDWQIGKPDRVLDMGVDFEVPAQGPLPVQVFRVDPQFENDVWLAALEARPGNADVVREIIVYVQNPGGGIAVPDGGPLGNGHLGVYARGRTASHYPAGTGKLIKRGAKLIFAVLYAPNGTVTTDRSKVALKFHAAPVRKQIVTRGIAETGFQIPPHVENFPIYATYTFTEPVTLLSMRPLMHYRGQRFKYIAHFPDGRDEVLLHVDRYDYDWQTHYSLKDPIRMPAGTVLECIATMNNSHDNFQNPEPHATVRHGDQPTDEKMIGWIDYTRDGEDLTPPGDN